LLPGALNDTAGGWLTGGTGQSQLLSAAGQNPDQTLMAALYQQQTAAIQQVTSSVVLAYS